DAGSAEPPGHDRDSREREAQDRGCRDGTRAGARMGVRLEELRRRRIEDHSVQRGKYEADACTELEALILETDAEPDANQAAHDERDRGRGSVQQEDCADEGD